MEEILARTADAFGLTVADLKGNSRAQHIVWARQAAALILKECGLGYSLVTIAQALGRRDHTTIMHALRQASTRRQAEPAYDRRLRLIKESVNYE